jgi:hypothetical protein
MNGLNNFIEENKLSHKLPDTGLQTTKYKIRESEESTAIQGQLSLIKKQTAIKLSNPNIQITTVIGLLNKSNKGQIKFYPNTYPPRKAKSHTIKATLAHTIHKPSRSPKTSP